MSAKISIDRERIADFCRRHHIAKLAFFGMEEELAGVLDRKVGRRKEGGRS